VNFDIEGPFTLDIEGATIDIEVVYDIEVFAIEGNIDIKGINCDIGVARIQMNS
jgi:hypothetical protein